LPAGGRATLNPLIVPTLDGIATAILTADSMRRIDTIQASVGVPPLTRSITFRFSAGSAALVYVDSLSPNDSLPADGFTQTRIHGRVTDRMFAPIAITGYVPDVLQTVSAVGNDFALDAGACGKGHKETVLVTSGGPHLLMKARLG
ncbi:MAG: hypothetical protein HGB05_16790, partial [Chloroflexi bacterium]|nr:hypothetical protein [Chloroflexota bacterium]